jgi:hypothetical protein
MSDQPSTNPFDNSIVQQYPPLPRWLARRVLRGGERVTWVRGPWFSPSWERYATHPGLFLVTAAIGVAILALALLVAGSWAEVPIEAVMIAFGPPLVSIYVLGFCAGYFTRLVVTNYRLFVVQGYEVRRCWNLSQLPPSLMRYAPRRDGDEEAPAVDLEKLQTMLGGAPSDQFIAAKSIRDLGKQLDRIQTTPRGKPPTA